MDVEGCGVVPEVEAPEGSGFAPAVAEVEGCDVTGLVPNVEGVGDECGELVEDIIDEDSGIGGGAGSA